MELVFCILGLSAMALSFNFVQAGISQNFSQELRNNHCRFQIEICEKRMVIKPTSEDIMGLCNAKPLSTTSSKCLIDCQMRQYEWMNDNGFQTNKYMDFIIKSEFGYDDTYVQSAEEAAQICKDKKAPYYDACEAAYIILNCLQEEGDKRQKINVGFALFYVRKDLFDSLEIFGDV